MKSLNFDSFVQNTAPAVDRLISDFYDRKLMDARGTFMYPVFEDIREYCLRPGKRIRPVLVMAGYNGYRKGKKAPETILPLAAAVEMMHSFLLIQDDIADRADTRRGGPAMHIICHRRYSENSFNKTIGQDVAGIVADVLFSNALELVSSASLCSRVKNRFMTIFAGTYEKTAMGQILDIIHSGCRDLSSTENIPVQVSTMKTAYYTIYYPLLMGYAAACPVNSEENRLIEKFSLPLGLAFQMRDDVLGVFGEEKETGKPSDSDIKEGKYTILIRETMNLLPEKDCRLFTEKFLSVKKTKSDVNFIRKSIMESGGLETVRKKQNEYIDSSLKALGSLSLSKASAGVLEDMAWKLRLS